MSTTLKLLETGQFNLLKNMFSYDDLSDEIYATIQPIFKSRTYCKFQSDEILINIEFGKSGNVILSIQRDNEIKQIRHFDRNKLNMYKSDIIMEISLCISYMIIYDHDLYMVAGVYYFEQNHDALLKITRRNRSILQNLYESYIYPRVSNHDKITPQRMEFFLKLNRLGSSVKVWTDSKTPISLSKLYIEYDGVITNVGYHELTPKNMMKKLVEKILDDICN